MTSRAFAGRVVHARLESRALVGNPLGDPSTRDLYVYEPPGYDGVKRFPVVVLLAAFGGDGRSFLDGGPWKPSVVQRFDELVERGDAEPALLVMPDGTNRWGGSQYLDSPASGAYQTYLADEVIPFVDSSFRTIPEANGRCIAGRSSGGFGALRLALDRPGLVGALASHAGDAAFELSLRPMLVAAAVAMARHGSPDAFVEKMRLFGPTASGDHDAIFVVAALAAYASEALPASPHFAWPFDPSSAAIDEAAWAKVSAHDPLVRVRTATSLARDLAFAFVDAGSGDEHGLGFAAKALASELTARGVMVRHELHEGGHRGTSHRFGASIPAMLAALQPLR